MFANFIKYLLYGHKCMYECVYGICLVPLCPDPVNIRALSERNTISVRVNTRARIKKHYITFHSSNQFPRKQSGDFWNKFTYCMYD